MTEPQRLATLRLYRMLQRECQSFPKVANDLILLQPLLEAPDWGRHVMFHPSSQTSTAELHRLFCVWADDTEMDDWYYQIVANDPSAKSMPPLVSMTCWTNTRQLQEAIQQCFRTEYHGIISVPALHRMAIRAIQVLQEQQALWTHSSVATTDGVRVTATSR